jgi:hypothetical protein
LHSLVGPPRGEAEAPASNPPELGCRRPVIRCEDRAEDRRDDVEGRVLVWERLRIADLERNRHAGRLRTRRFDHPWRNVDADDLRSGPSSPDRDRAGAGGDVEPVDARGRLEARYHLVVDRREPLRQPLIIRRAPELGGSAAQSDSCASAVSSFRTCQSSG